METVQQDKELFPEKVWSARELELYFSNIPPSHPHAPGPKPTAFPRRAWEGTIFGFPPWTKRTVDLQVNWACRKASKLWTEAVECQSEESEVLWKKLGGLGFTLAVVDRVIQLNLWRRINVVTKFDSVEEWRAFIVHLIDQTYDQARRTYIDDIRGASKPFPIPDREAAVEFARRAMDHSFNGWEDSSSMLRHPHKDRLAFDLTLLNDFAQKEGEVETATLRVKMFTPGEARAVINSVASQHPNVVMSYEEREKAAKVKKRRTTDPTVNVVPASPSTAIPGSPESKPTLPPSPTTDSTLSWFFVATAPVPPPTITTYEQPTSASSKRPASQEASPGFSRIRKVDSPISGTGTGSSSGGGVRGSISSRGGSASRGGTPISGSGPPSRTPTPLTQRPSNIPTEAEAVTMAQGEEEAPVSAERGKPERGNP